VETQIKTTLAALLAAISSANGPAIADGLARLDQLLAAAPPGSLHPQLAHYLERRSYAKALAWLDGGGPGGQTPPGGCGGREPKTSQPASPA
jgi:predicted component of type VI protein secretion system